MIALLNIYFFWLPITWTFYQIVHDVLLLKAVRSSAAAKLADMINVGMDYAEGVL